MKSMPSVAAVLFMLVLTQAEAQIQFQQAVHITAHDSIISIPRGELVPAVYDWNGDGRKDLLVGQFDEGHIRLYLNEGSDEAPRYGGYSLLTAGGAAISLPHY